MRAVDGPTAGPYRPDVRMERIATSVRRRLSSGSGLAPECTVRRPWALVFCGVVLTCSAVQAQQQQPSGPGAGAPSGGQEGSSGAALVPGASGAQERPPGAPVGTPSAADASGSALATPATPGAAAGDAPSAGEPSQSAQPQASRDVARVAYAQGTELFSQGKYAEAKAAFERAYAAVPNPIVLLPIAEAELKLNDVASAIATLERYLSTRPEAPDRAQIAARIAHLEALPAMIVLSSELPGLRVTLDSVRVKVPSLPLELKVPAGEHTLEVTADGYDSVTHKLVAKPGGRHAYTPPLTKLPEPEPTVAVAPDRPDEPVEDISAALWAAGIVGASGLVAGSVLGFMALSENSDFDTQPSEDSADRGERLALFADVAFGVGAMALVTGAVLYLTEGDGPGEDQARRAFNLTAAASPDGAFVATTIRY